MPVTVRTCNFRAARWSPPSGGKPTSNPVEILQAADSKEAEKCKEVLQCSTSKTNSPEPILPSPNGLLYAAVEAWNRHYNLILRPDDFWFAILSQLCLYISANAEALRSHFVGYDAKKNLQVEQLGGISTVHYDLFAFQMAEAIGKNVKDPKLVDWVLPNFTTTTSEDRTLAAVLFMGAMQEYFEYVFECTLCGIPEITLLGDREDWVKLQNRLDRLLLWGKEAEQYHEYLTPIFNNIIATFDDPTSEAVVSFWRVMVLHHGPNRESGMKMTPYITGWITGFFLWGSDGKIRDEVCHPNPWSGAESVVFEKVRYLRLHLGRDIIPVIASVPVVVRELDGRGKVVRQINTRMTGGICGFKACERATPADLESDTQSFEGESPTDSESDIIKPFERETPDNPEPNVKPLAARPTGLGLWHWLSACVQARHNNKKGMIPKWEDSKLGAESTQVLSNTVKPVTFWWIYKV